LSTQSLLDISAIGPGTTEIIPQTRLKIYLGCTRKKQNHNFADMSAEAAAQHWSRAQNRQGTRNLVHFIVKVK